MAGKDTLILLMGHGWLTAHADTAVDKELFDMQFRIPFCSEAHLFLHDGMAVINVHHIKQHLSHLLVFGRVREAFPLGRNCFS